MKDELKKMIDEMSDEELRLLMVVALELTKSRK